LRILPLTPARWRDFERLFGPKGACAGCWCMYPRRRQSDFRRGQTGGGAGNRRAMRALVWSGAVPGLIAYAGSTPVGWIAIAPREEYPRLERSRVARAIDSRPVWSIPCVFVAKEARRRGMSSRLARAAVRWARSRGARIVEAYPVEAPSGKLPDAFAWWGTRAGYERAGFEVVARPSKSRAVVRAAARK
jgi:GNAT superfamily N-acetyltransferase